MCRDPSEINGDKLNNVRSETGRYFRNKKRKYLKEKINDLATNSTNKNFRDLYRRINECKKCYKQRNNLVIYESGDLIVDSHNILKRYKNYFFQLLNEYDASDVRQLEVHRLNCYNLVPVVLRLKLLLQRRKSLNRQIVIKFWQNLFKQEAKY
jgi:hypothetical protein